MSTLVIVPTFDEAGNIRTLLRRVLAAAPQVHVLVVDDGSPDGTADLVQAVATADERVHLLRRTVKDGLGGAYRAGFAWGDAAGYDVLVEMDADLSHPPEALPRLLDALDDADLVIGSRYVAGGATEGWPWHRQLVSRAGNAYVELALGLGIRDATAGYRAFRAGALSTIGVQSLRSTGYCFQVETAYRARRARLRVAETPITFVERVVGSSKMSTQIVVEALLRVTWWALREGRAPRTGAGSGSRVDASTGADDRGSARVRWLGVGALLLAVVLGLGAAAAAMRSVPASVGASGAAPAPSPPVATGDASVPARSEPSTPTPPSSEVTAPQAVPPVHIDIPAIGVAADVGELGVAAEGVVEVPTDFDDAGWLTTSALPGERGPAVVLGHVDSRNGPAVFDRIDELATGDAINLVGDDGTEVTYTVTGSSRYPKEDFPTQLVYGPAPGPLLRLITCGGVFDSAVGHYEDNVIVFAAQT